MRIVHIITRLIVGGAQENTLLSCEGQHRHGHDVTLITGPPVGPEGSLMARARAGGYGVEVIEALGRSIGPIKDWRSFGQLVERLRELRPDVVHTHSSKAGILGRRAARRAGVGVVIHTIHGLAFTASRWRVVNYAYKVAERRAAPLANRIVCVADAMRDMSLAAGIGVPQQYVTIYSGMATQAFLAPPVERDLVRQRLGISEDQVVVGTIARLFHLKGHEDLLEMAPELCRRYAKLRFLWIGDGILRQPFERQMSQMGLRDRFILSGLVEPERIPELTAAMDLLVHPSRREGLARALPQAALAGKPVITYDIDGAAEGLQDGISGFLIRPFDKARLAEAMRSLLDDAQKRHTMGLAGRAFALGRFDADVMVDALETLYRREMSAGIVV